MQTSAVMPTLIMALYRLNQGLEPIDPHPDLPYAANYLYMLTGEVPDPDHARAIEQYLISTTDHGFNSSTFTARVITSTGADLGAAVVGAIGALSGPLHGGAPSRALDMLDAIGTPDKAEAWIRERGRAAASRIMGFGHRVYKTDDPRSVMLRGVAERLGGDMVEFAKKVEKTVVDVLAELKPGRHLYANVEFYAGVVMDNVRPAPRRCSRRRSRPAGSSAGRATSSSRRPTTASSGPAPTTSAAAARRSRARRVSLPMRRRGGDRGQRPSWSTAFAAPRCPQLSRSAPAPGGRRAGRDRAVAGHRPARGPRRRRGDRRQPRRWCCSASPPGCGPGSRTSSSTRRRGARAWARRSAARR